MPVSVPTPQKVVLNMPEATDEISAVKATSLAPRRIGLFGKVTVPSSSRAASQNKNASVIPITSVAFLVRSSGIEANGSAIKGRRKMFFISGRELVLPWPFCLNYLLIILHSFLFH